jgi:hypothetical protein
MRKYSRKNRSRKNQSRKNRTRRRKGGGFSDWQFQKGNDAFTSYTNNRFPGKHCTIWKSGDVHCKVKGGRQCGTFHGEWECNDNKAREMYNDFTVGL